MADHDRFHDGPFSDRPRRDGVLVDLECIDGPEDCQGAVAMRWPGYGTRCYPRCKAHGEARVRREEENIRRYAPDGPCAPQGFDPADAGEVWDDE